MSPVTKMAAVQIDNFFMAENMMEPRCSQIHVHVLYEEICKTCVYGTLSRSHTHTHIYVYMYIYIYNRAIL